MQYVVYTKINIFFPNARYKVLWRYQLSKLLQVNLCQHATKSASIYYAMLL